MSAATRLVFTDLHLTGIASNGGQNCGTEDVSDRPAICDLVWNGEQRTDAVTRSESPREERDVEEGHNGDLDGKEPAK